MKTINLIQGTSEWHAHRATHFNASDAPAMLGVSPYKSRVELMRERATGIVPDIDAATQRRFDDGHSSEALARPIAEQIIAEELYPCTGVSEKGLFSASFDGLTLLGDTAFEHKLLASRLRDAMTEGCTGADLPEDYRVQMEQQCMVSDAERVLFMASEWDAGGNLIEERHCWYTPDTALRSRIIAGWSQFDADLVNYQPEPVSAPASVGRAPETLPALRVEAQGMVTYSNLAEFRENAMAVLGNINRELQSDDDFADAEQTVKWCKGVEDRLAATKAAVLAQMQSVDEVCRTIDVVTAETRCVRLELDKLVKCEKERRRGEIVEHYQLQVTTHLANINATLGQFAVTMPLGALTEIGAAIKGRKTLGSITDAADEAAANLKISLSQQADRVRQNVAILDAYRDHAHLFADAVALAHAKQPEDLKNLVSARIAEYAEREAKRIEAERERIRAEETEKLQREQDAREASQQAASQAAMEIELRRQQEPEQRDAPVAQPVEQLPSKQTVAGSIPAGRSTARIKLGDINARIAPLSINADGLASLGFHPVGTDRAAKLYDEADFTAMCRAMYGVIRDAAMVVEQRKAG